MQCILHFVYASCMWLYVLSLFRTHCTKFTVPHSLNYISKVHLPQSYSFNQVVKTCLWPFYACEIIKTSQSIQVDLDQNLPSCGGNFKGKANLSCMTSQYKWHMKRPKEATGPNTETHSDTHQHRSFKQDLYFSLQVFPFCFLTPAKLMQTWFGITQVDELNYL